MKKLYLRLLGHQTYNFWNSDFLIFPTFKQLLSKNLSKNFQVSKYILKLLIKFYRFTNICDLNLTMKQRPFDFIFEICTEERFVSYILSNGGNIKASIFADTFKMYYCGLFSWKCKFHSKAVFKLQVVEFAIPFFPISNL